MTTLRNKALMLVIILLLSFAWLAIEVSTWLMALMARGALSVARSNVYLFQIDQRLNDARARLDAAFGQIVSFLKVRAR